MRRNALAVTIFAALAALAACGGEDEPSRPGGPATVPNPVPHEQALELIRACRVTGVGATHAGEVEISLEGGRTVFVEDPDGEALFAAAADAQQRSCDIEMYTE